MTFQTHFRPPCLSSSLRETSLPCVQICVPSALNLPRGGGEKTADELREENAALRRELAKLKGVESDEVQYG